MMRTGAALLLVCAFSCTTAVSNAAPGDLTGDAVFQISGMHRVNGAL